jgi:radical SAM superfamily enzyme YgiQ (UPF0313 family)
MKFDSKEDRAMMPYPPLGTLYAASFLKSHGYTVAVFDSMLALSENEIIPYLIEHTPKIVVIYDDDFNYLTKMCLRRMREAAYRLTALAKQHYCDVIVHGSDPADHANEYIEHGADYVIIGEGEITLLELIQNIHKPTKSEVSGVHGLAYLSQNNVHRTPHRPVLTHLDQLPFPDRTLISVASYRERWKRHHGYFSINMVTTRGCPYHCNWCAKPIYGQVYHSRSPENVVEEMRMIKKDFQPDHLWFCDDIFGLKPGWIRAFADTIASVDAFIPFKCLSRADLLLKDDTVRHLKRSGCQTVWIGAESGSQRILDAMEKGTTVEDIYRSTLLLHEQNIRVGFFIQYGYPGEQHSDIELTLEMIRKCRPDEIGISVSYPLPGTKFYENVKAELGDKQNWIESQDLDMMYKGTFPPEYYRTLHTLTHKKFRLWQGKEILKHAATNPFSLNKQKMRRIASIPFHALTLPSLQSALKRIERYTYTR